MGQRGGQMGFAYTDATKEDDVGVVLEECQAHEVLKLRAVDLFGPGPVVGVEGLEDGEAGGLDAPFDAVFPSPMRFALQEVGEIVRIGPVVLEGGFGGLPIVLLDPGQLKFLQVCFDFLFHGLSLGW